MNIRDFVRQLPDDFFDELEESSIDAIVKALPDRVFSPLASAVKKRVQASEDPHPTDTEWKRWRAGNQPGAMLLMRKRTGLGLAELKKIFQRGWLNNFTEQVFDDDDPNPEAGLPVE